ncbi:hypothetical protein CXB51_028768 [Gossypium anomalum]|uniref:Reverse transcriptase/retrotransposon-derived protein RNase H-like domain-containing protein n=1 Tax=Gossypium anomalum TaxID=47600 RepID=A0A8J5Y0P2_9ROSI|nr:hypothetical protein CXB51_028768 [Gossypium anomalum]
MPSEPPTRGQEIQKYRQEFIGYLGHIISAQGVTVDPDKIQVVSKWPQPNPVKEVRSFLDLARYYRCFILHYTTVVGLLSDLLKKDNFYWNSQVETAFRQL